MTHPSLSPLLGKAKKDGPVLVVIAGPNGAGKSTFYDEYVAPLGLPYVNADLIVKKAFVEGKKISDYEAAKIAEGRRQKYVERKESFCFETVFSDRVGSKRKFFKRRRWRA